MTIPRNLSILAEGASSSGVLGTANGGTGATTASAARTALSAAASGANSDITSLSGLTSALSVAQGGTGATSLTANNVLLGNGTSAVQVVAPGASGNILTSNGTSWTSAAAPASAGSITAVATGSISNGATVSLNSDGTVSATGNLTSTLSAGTPAAIRSGAFIGLNYTCATLVNSTTVVVFWINNTGYITGTVGTVSGTSITFGSNQTLVTGDWQNLSCAYSSSLNRFVIAAYDNSSQNPTLHLISLSGGTLSVVVSNYQPWGVYQVQYQMACTFDSNNVLYVVFAGSTSPLYCVYANTVNVTASAMTLVTTSQSGTYVQQSPASILNDPVTGNTLITFQNGSGYPCVRSLAAGTSTQSATTILASQPCGQIASFYLSNASKLGVAWIDQSVSGYGISVSTGSITGNSPSFSSKTNIFSSIGSGSSGLNCSFDPLTNAVTGAFYDGSSLLKGFSINFSGTTASAGTSPTTLFSASTYPSSQNNQGLLYINKLASVLIYATSNSGGVLNGVVVTDPGTYSSSGSFIGFSSASYTNGQTATINTVGSSNSGQSGLTAGTKYYVANDGTLSSSSTTLPYAGIAMSATKILVKG